MSRWLMAAAVVLVLAGEAHAEWTRGNELHKWCSSDVDGYASACAAYVSGIADVMEYAPVQEFKAWFSGEILRGQLTDVVKRWLEQHPELRHHSAVKLVPIALSEAFPCE